MHTLFKTIKKFFTAPDFEGDEDKTRRARLLHVVLNLQAYVIALAFAGSLYVALTTDIDQSVGLIVLGSSFFLVMFWRFLMRRGKISIASAGLIIAYTLGIASAIAATGTIQSSGIIFFPLTIVMAVLLINRRAGILAFIGVIMVGMGIAQMEISGVLPQANTPTNLVSMGVTLFSGLGLTLVLLYLATQGIEGALQRARKSEQEVRELASSLEQRVIDRTKALEVSATISRRLTSILDPYELTRAVVNEVRDAYNYYYSQVYLFDDARENLVLTAGTGEQGVEMLKRGHTLAKGHGIVGLAAETKQTILVSDTSKNPDWLPNELLPNTKAEVVVPISIGDQVLGVLDVQDDVINEIFSEDLTLLESVARQVAVSLQNARQFKDVQSLREQYTLAVEGSNDGIWDWDMITNEVYYSPRWKAMIGYREDELNNGFADFEALLHPEDHDMVLTSVNDYVTGKNNAYDIEFRFRHKDGSYRWIRARGKALYDLKGAPYRMAGSHTDITDSKVSEQNIAQRARQQEAINTITQIIQSASTVEEAMQVAARELGNALGKRQTVVALEPSIFDGQIKLDNAGERK